MYRKSVTILATVAALFLAAPDSIMAQRGGYDGPGRSHDSRGDWDGRGGSSRGDWRHDDDRDRGRGHGRHYVRSGPVSIRNSRSRTVIVELRDTYGNYKGRRYLSPGEREYFSSSARSGWTITVRQGPYVRRYSLSSLASFSNGRWYARIH